tara:strand:+ start:703 stop:906 length:204 start_codon:yes stop_codon:yes gene_type:complete
MMDYEQVYARLLKAASVIENEAAKKKWGLNFGGATQAMKDSWKLKSDDDRKEPRYKVRSFRVGSKHV